ncbi:hypothetical protein [Actinacidiphila acididurans]|uniref:Uncharacterized protein n=1 Tax=Actinacidiphila acididurans TaxID=2784346 RepID=A0ABS2TSG2_9ACTN|nr:hypothetical protein [Actinacidiphila acididurans]MBM9506278.1 hypothetical protein [Actinacidiphila acididurans]
MKTGPAAVALAGSYVLGRMRKPQWALAVAGAVVARRLRAQGGDALGGILQSPGLGKLGEDLRGNVTAAGKAAAMAAAAHRMDALSDRIAERTAALRGTADTGPEDQGDGEAAETEAEDTGEEAPDRGEKREAGGKRRTAPRSGSRSEAARQKGDAEAKRSPAKRAPARSSRTAREGDSRKAAGRGPSRRTGSTERGGARTSGREER